MGTSTVVFELDANNLADYIPDVSDEILKSLSSKAKKSDTVAKQKSIMLEYRNIDKTNREHDVNSRKSRDDKLSDAIEVLKSNPHLIPDLRSSENERRKDVNAILKLREKKTAQN